MARPGWAFLFAAVLLSPARLPAADELPFYSVPGDRHFERTPRYRDDDDHFRYGSLGGERGYKGQVGFGLPYWIWVALPELFPEYLPDRQPGRGYSSFGYIYEEEGDRRFQLPIGTSQRNSLALDRVWINCGACHTGTYRDSPQGERHIVLGMPANRYNQGEWVRFLFAAASDPRFDGEHMVRKIRELEKERRKVGKDRLAGPRLPKELNVLEEQIYKRAVVPLMRQRILFLKERLGFIDFTTWGPGRVDTFNAPKALLNFPMHLAPESEKRGNADLPSVWYQKGREGMQLHWDGNNTSVDERNLSASFAATIPPLIDKCSLRRMARFLRTLAPPPFPPGRIDRALAARGEPLYNAHCASCHGAAVPPFRRDGGIGKYVGTVTPLPYIGTDRARFNSYTPELVRAQNSIYAQYPLANSRECPGDPGSKDYPARFTHFRKTDGYANSPLDGIWLRAPYLHNGSVPTLRDLLNPIKDRPQRFWTGYDVYDFEKVGFVTQGPEAQAEGWLYDTELTANGNEGHEYGTKLTAGEKDALLEYLKTF